MDTVVVLERILADLPGSGHNQLCRTRSGFRGREQRKTPWGMIVDESDELEIPPERGLYTVER